MENGTDSGLGQVQLFATNVRRKTKKRKVEPELSAGASKEVLRVDSHAHANAHDDASFSDLGLSEWLEKVCSDLGIVEPTPVQRGCIPAILQGRDVIGVVRQGVGKLLPLRYQCCIPLRKIQTACVIATPGRLQDLIERDASLADCFRRTSFLILDEADRLLDESFESALDTILSALPAKRQTLLFSATMTETLITLQKSLLQNAYVFEAYSGLKTASGLKEDLHCCIVFAGTRKSCENLALVLSELEIQVAPLHSGLAQRNRMASLDRFRSGRVSILLATDVASRGLDIPEVDLVVNFDLPKLASDYVHRVGRTARAGGEGWSLSFVSQYDIELLKSIESLTGK
eukprot:jgi/Picre1/27163/NNA_000132.t1